MPPPGFRVGESSAHTLRAQDLELTVSGARPFGSGLCFYGDQEVQVVPVGNGVRCVDGSLHRMRATSADANGRAQRSFPFAANPVTAGTRFGFQYMYRDIHAGGALFNASNALWIEFAP